MVVAAVESIVAAAELVAAVDGSFDCVDSV